MERLSLHIEYLLLRHDCVVVPGFGGFINVHRSAGLDPMTGRYNPMEREVRFNGALIHDDGILATSYARKYRISFQEGRELLMRDTDSFIRMLEEDGEVTIGRLGVIRREEESIRFIPLHSPTYLAEETGYMPIRPLLRNKQEESAADNAEKKTSKQGRRFDTRRNYYIAINKMFAKTAACFILVASVAMALINPPKPSGGIENQASVVPVERIIRTAKEHIDPSVNRGTEIASPNAVEDSPAKEETKSEEGSMSDYYLIVATFKSQAEAERFIAVQHGGKDGLEIVNSGKMWRVSAQSGNDRGALTAALNSPEFKKEFGEGWIWSNPASDAK